MSIYAVERVKSLMDCLVNQAVVPLVAACNEIEAVERWLEDEDSREQYRRELALVVLRGLVKNDATAEHYVQVIDAGEFAQTALRAAQQVDALLAAGKLPTMEFPADEQVIRNVYAIFFGIEPYQYGAAVTLREGDVFLDCGAYCGETALWAAYKGAGKVYAFEPVPRSFEYLRRNAERGGGGCIVPVPFGLGAAPGRLSLVLPPDGGLDSIQLVASGNEDELNDSNSVPVVALDDWCRENEVKPDFIKMDLEGGEVDTINGARGIIAEYKPRLAICLYHRLSDMWVIPRLIKEIVPEYRFWCRKVEKHDFILYADVP
ncbi:hypothetical protein AGMMS50225_14680 [Betaproteobacteria bacterium]|nr:hypothetical protein AGMMS50225_14680 [Betaproteobacteria bacterium]